ncbi:uncharacterized protein LTR77_004892 [Saxophila tyrrhenica]|uniref:glucan endo-1,3-beta-D-glucosidase n=1 Tax=Saxophila tyrrhenica TaxID=1690608 RepID=A0AAV9PB29_9PEZI|nr:hypothetical protein LTR77_004892 [Saxophila tyrrhenica]
MSGYNYGVPGPEQTYNPQQYQRSPPRRPVAPYARQPATASPPPSYRSDGANGPYAAYSPYASTNPEHDPTVAGGERHPLPSVPQPSGNDDDYYGAGQMSPVPSNPFTHSYSGDSVPASTQQSLHSVSTVGYGYGHDQSMPGGRTPYRGDGYDEYMDPRNIADDGEDGFDLPQRRPRSRFGMAGAAGGAGAGAVGLKAFSNQDASGSYGPVNGGTADAEKSEWLNSQSTGKKKLKWTVGIIIVLVILGAIAGGVAYALLNNDSDSDSNSSNGGGRGSSSAADGVWDKDSPQVQAVMNNKNLHKVFPAMDYTPWNAQYPACLSNMPYQNDVTVDVAVLAQLTPAIRLYGTDCKQTEQVLKGIDLLGLTDTLKVWLGVYIGDNSTTNNRQLEQMYSILDDYPSSHFAGVIVGNEVLYAETVTITELGNQISKVRQGLAKRNIDLPVATADLGDNWTAGLAADSDIVMANVHPFFAGVTPDKAPAWTWTFWKEHDVVLKSNSGGNWPANIISETGWPTEGGNDCGTGAKCTSKTAGAVAGIDELNTFMEGWVCQSMSNTTYFWFEAFDEPWKEVFNDKKTGDFWEPHWGLFDVDRNLKKGVKIPDCGGKTLDTPY